MLDANALLKNARGLIKAKCPYTLYGSSESYQDKDHTLAEMAGLLLQCKLNASMEAVVVGTFTDLFSLH
ncbi:hypothetical protein EON65_48130 [archaeon]|nr:MAG: hypothetical protein EON65_48130 [archaeon]